MPKSDLVRLRHMLDAAKEAQIFASGRSRTDLDTDRKLSLALIKLIEIIGEAANGVTAECRARYPQIPWMDAIGMRHRLIHAYYDVNLDILWATITKDLPLLISEVERAVETECRE